MATLSLTTNMFLPLPKRKQLSSQPPFTGVVEVVLDTSPKWARVSLCCSLVIFGSNKWRQNREIQPTNS